jgi:hypothetical protein
MSLRNLYDRMVEVAASVDATEMAVFSVARGLGGPDLKNVLHVRGGDATDDQREAAVDAFRDIVRRCVARRKHGVIRIAAPPDAAGRDPFCLVALTRRSGEVVGAAAFIVRRRDLDEARAALVRVNGAGG